jgi:hypothetical protein
MLAMSNPAFCGDSELAGGPSQEVSPLIANQLAEFQEGDFPIPVRDIPERALRNAKEASRLPGVNENGFCLDVGVAVEMIHMTASARTFSLGAALKADDPSEGSPSYWPRVTADKAYGRSV